MGASLIGWQVGQQGLEKIVRRKRRSEIEGCLVARMAPWSIVLMFEHLMMGCDIIAGIGARCCHQRRGILRDTGTAITASDCVDGRASMMTSMIKGLAAAAVLSTLVVPAMADTRYHRHDHHAHMLPMISYLHNYGPGPFEGSYAYFDGPLRINCKQGAAAYRGQDGRGHPCR